jgi:hypothetical protein
MNNNTKTATATMPATVAGVYLRLARGCGSDRPDVCAESGGVSPGRTPPPGSRLGVRAGSGSGGWAVTRGAYPPNGAPHLMDYGLLSFGAAGIAVLW